MAAVPGLPTLINSIKNDPNLTAEEKRNLIEDARYFAKDGKLTLAEKQSVKSDQAVFGSPNNGAISVPITTGGGSGGNTGGGDTGGGTGGNVGGGTAGGETRTTPAAPPAIPLSTWDTKTTYVAPTGIKQANPDIIIFDDPIDPEFLTQAFFQEFGGTELINISRSDLINGDQVSYSPIINLSSIRQSFNPNNIIAINPYQENMTKYGIDLSKRGVVEPYFDDHGDLIIEINQIRLDESIEVEIALDGTINRIEL